ncbi:MAG TPA: hypothetical protein VG675_13920 [Bryobacteraceae bacterium]|nr:hypothetical protein [Bryobacteraceae bacterium]
MLCWCVKSVLGPAAKPAELFRRMAPRFRLYELRHLRSEHAAEHLTQQVLVTASEPGACVNRRG